MAELKIDIDTSGALLEGRARRYISDFRYDATDAVAQDAISTVHRNLDRSIRHPTPYYETRIQIERASPDRVSVNDDRVIYGPWLEGTGSRNRTTRFKGYRSFRRAQQEVEGRVPATLTRLEQRLYRELSGG